MLYDIEMNRASEEFARAGKRHIVISKIQAQGPPQSWLKLSLSPPFLEHLSFITDEERDAWMCARRDPCPPVVNTCQFLVRLRQK